MEMLDADKNVVGFAPKLIMAIGKAAGFTPILKNMDFYELVNYLEENRKEYVRFILTGEE